ncbi:MAG: exosortase/archaeosortase family protein [Novosphingobium sp.]
MTLVGTATREPVSANRRPWSGEGRVASFVPMALLTLGLVVLYAPMMIEFGGKIWWDEDNSHAGILLLCLLAAFWFDRRALVTRASPRDFILGSAGVAAGLVIYGFGQVVSLLQLQALSMPTLGAGLALAVGGRPLLRRWWLLILLLAFTVPWIGPAADWLLVPLRLKLTYAAVTLLSAFGLPVSAMGVLVNVGFVQLNVAGACVGLRSTISIIALGLLSLHFFPPRSIRAGVIFVLLLPIIGLGANFLRVSFLIASAAAFGSGGVARLHDVAAYLEVALSLGVFMLVSSRLSAHRAARL